jgi:hypothetical protein
VRQKKAEERGNSTSTALVVSKASAIKEAFPDMSFDRENVKAFSKSAVAMMAGRIAGSRVNLTPNPLEDRSEQHKQLSK